MPTRGGYFIRNSSPARMDFRWFCLGNYLAILSSLATPEKSMAIMDLIESRWEELAGVMPLKVCYPAIENHERKIVTGCVSKNARWNYHNGGSWPVTCCRCGLYIALMTSLLQPSRPGSLIARRAIELAESRLVKDIWPEYCDRWAELHPQLRWAMMLENPSHLDMIALEDDKQMKPVMRRSNSWTC
ncbi:alkaline/neutral invertase CINV2 [Pyrus ussuriensis x Pyrus communis]|uniref:Alkaline/neutral invertase n=1 Tax=Pyrus ussuriensis x Pyrus communis TaxID=2448454 RepID=A0A5N5FHQ1_9ROSA|nr:alkaline/neutral invertase CINV2 [Pyrus ussuriensis x Pyrus communis]